MPFHLMFLFCIFISFIFFICKLRQCRDAKAKDCPRRRATVQVRHGDEVTTLQHHNFIIVTTIPPKYELVKCLNIWVVYPFNCAVYESSIRMKLTLI